MDGKTVPALVGEAARRADCSTDTIRRAIDEGRLSAVRTQSGLRLIDRASLEAFARERAERRRKLADEGHEVAP